jgi:3-methyladenine DNA glycosylase AlkC
MAKKTGAISPEQQSKAALLKRVKSSDIDEVTLSDCVGLFVEVDRAIARKQDTSSAILERLSHHSDKIVRQAVASHHNILSEDLMRLGKQFPDAFLSNPALDLILIENPGLLLNFDESLLVQIAKREACPEAFLKWAMRQGSEQVLMAIAMNPSTPVELLQQLLVSEFKPVQEAVRFHTKLLDGMEVSDIQAHFKQAVIERLNVLSSREAYQMWRRKELSLVHFCYLSIDARLLIVNGDYPPFVVQKPFTSSWLLAKLAKDSDDYVRKTLAENPNTPSSSLTLLAKDDDKLVRESVAKNPNAPSALLTILAKDKHNLVRSGVASNPNVPEDLLTLFSNDESSSVRVRSAVASNSNTPIELLMTLAEDCSDTNLNVLWQVACNPKTPRELVQKLSPILLADLEIHPDRYFCINYQNAPIEFQQKLLSTLAKSKYKWSRNYAAEKLSTPMASLALLAEDKDKEVRQSVARNPNTPIESLMTLAEDCSDTKFVVLWNIASNPNISKELFQKLLPVFLADFEKNTDRDFRFETPDGPIELQQELLSRLAKNRYKKSRFYAAENLNTTADSLALLAEDKDKEIRHAAANNPNTPEVSLKLLAEDKSKEVRCAVANLPNIPEPILTQLTKDKDKWVRAAVAANTNCSLSILETLFIDKDIEVRCGVAINPKATKEMLEALAKDESKKVCSWLAFNPKCPTELLIKICYDKSMFEEAQERAIEILNLPEEILFLPHFESVRCRVAEDPNTTKAMLEKLVKDKSKRVRSCIVFNPQCPTELLIQLCHDKNISIDAKASAIEKLNFPEDILALPHFNSILQTKAIPEQVLVCLGQHKDSEVRFAALSNPLHPSWIKSLIEAPKTNPLFIKWASKAQQSAQSALESDNVFFFAGKDANKAAVSTSELVRVFAMSDGASVEPARLAKSQKHNDWLVRMSIASNIGTPINALNKLKQDSHSLVAKQAEMTIAKLSDKPEIGLLDEDSRQSSFYELSKDIAVVLKSKRHQTVAIDDPVWGHCINPAVLWDQSRINEVTETWTDAEWQLFGEWILPLAPKALAPYLTSEAIETFMVKHLKRKNKSLEYLASVILYSEAALKLLAKDKDDWVRKSVAGNSNTPEALLKLLSKDKDYSVRRCIARNPNTPEALLSQLSKDKYPSVRKGVAENPDTPEALMTLLSEDKDSGVRQAAVENINPPEFILKQLAKDEENKVRGAVATDPDTSKETFETSSTNKYACLQSLPLAEYKEHILIALSPEITLPTDITTLDIRRGVESLGLLSEEVSHKELTEMRISKDRLQRVAVCFHDKATESLLSILSEDKDLAIAEIAKEMLAPSGEDDDYALLY